MQDVGNIIAEIIEKYVDLFQKDDSNFNKSLSELGMESMAFVHIIVDIEERFGIEIPDEMLLRGELDTVQQLTEVVLKFVGVNEKEVTK